MFETINGLQLTSKETALCHEVFAMALSEEDGARKLIEANFENAEETYTEIERGVDNFFSMMANEFANNEMICQKLTEAMKDMTPAQKLRYLTNILITMSYTGSTLHQSDVWTDVINNCKNFLAAIDNGEMDEELIQNNNLIDKLLDLICQHVEDTAILFIGNQQYEHLLEVCKTANAEEVQMLAANTRKISLAAACAMWTLYANGNLPSLVNLADKDAGYTPYSMGVIAACTLEMDAAQKSGPWEKVKSLLLKAARIAVVLLLTGAAVYGAFKMIPIITNLAYQLFHMANVAKVIGLFSGLYLAIVNLVKMPVLAGNLFDLGAKLVTVTVSAVRTGCRHMADYIHNHVIPGAWSLWNKCCEFVRTRIITPIAEKLHLTQINDDVDPNAVMQDMHKNTVTPVSSPTIIV